MTPRVTLLCRPLLAAFVLLGSPNLPAAEKVVVIGLFKDQAILHIDGQRRQLRIGETSPEGVKLIAANSEEAVLEIDGQRATYQLGTHISGRYSERRTGPVVRLWPDPDSGLYTTSGYINGFAMDFIVDTGASLISMNSNQADRLGIDYRAKGQQAMAQTASGLSKIYVVNLDRVRVGEIEVRDVRAAVHEGPYPIRVLLGNSFLEKIDLKRDGIMLQLQGRP